MGNRHKNGCVTTGFASINSCAMNYSGWFMFVCMEYRRGSHTKYKIEYHFIWVTKYRYQVLQGDLALRVRELVRQTCEYFEIQILRDVVRIIMSTFWCLPHQIYLLRALCEGSKVGCSKRYLQSFFM